MKNNVGRISQVLGAVVDVQFPGELPSILNALTTRIGDRTLVLETSPEGTVLSRRQEEDAAAGAGNGARVRPGGSVLKPKGGFFTAPLRAIRRRFG